MLEFQNGDALRSLDAQQRLDWQRGYQVIDPAGGSNLATTRTGAYEVDVAAGDVNAGGTTVTCTAATVDLSAEVGTTPKMAVIYRDAAGAAQYEVGPAQTRDPAGVDVRATFEPVAPSLYDVNGVAIAEVLLDDSVGDVTASELRDRRVPAELLVDSVDTETLAATDITTTTADVQTLIDQADNSINDFAGANLSVTTGTLNAAEADQATDEKLFFGDTDQWSLRYDGTATAWILRDETAAEDVLTANDGAALIEFARGHDIPSISNQDYTETVTTHTVAGAGTVTLDLSAANVHRIEATGDFTLEVSNVTGTPPGNSVLIKLIDGDATGPHTITYGTSWNTILWDQGTVRNEIPASGNIRISAETDDGGTNWWAIRSGRDFA